MLVSQDLRRYLEVFMYREEDIRRQIIPIEVSHSPLQFVSADSQSTEPLTLVSS